MVKAEQLEQASQRLHPKTSQCHWQWRYSTLPVVQYPHAGISTDRTKGIVPIIP